jgi:protoporphyrinogen oxidase
MMRVAIIGGGISGLSAAYALEKARASGTPVEYQLYESSPRLGGALYSEIVDGCVIEAGPDSFISEKPWAAALCRELGIGDQLIGSNDNDRKTWIVSGKRLLSLPDGLMFLVPTKILPTAFSPLFSWGTKFRMAKELLHPPRPMHGDESVAAFIERHFGREMVDRLADPMLSGIYGGDTDRLSVRATLGRFVEMEEKYGSLSRAMLVANKKMKTMMAGKPKPPLFTSLRNGMQQMVDALVSRIRPQCIALNAAVEAIEKRGGEYYLHISSGQSPAQGHDVSELSPEQRSVKGNEFSQFSTEQSFVKGHGVSRDEMAQEESRALALAAQQRPDDQDFVQGRNSAKSASGESFVKGHDLSRAEKSALKEGALAPANLQAFDAVIFATPANITGRLLANIDNSLSAELQQVPYSSSVTVSLIYDIADLRNLPGGHGFLVPRSEGRRMRACTFVHNKFPHRAPPDKGILRCFLGGANDEAILQLTDEEMLAVVHRELREILHLEAEPKLQRVYRWRGAMAQYPPGHLDRVDRIEKAVAGIPGLAIAGNAFRGIGVPDCVRTGTVAAATVLGQPDLQSR